MVTLRTRALWRRPLGGPHGGQRVLRTGLRQASEDVGGFLIAALPVEFQRLVEVLLASVSHGAGKTEGHAQGAGPSPQTERRQRPPTRDAFVHMPPMASFRHTSPLLGAREPSPLSRCCPTNLKRA